MRTKPQRSSRARPPEASSPAGLNSGLLSDQVRDALRSPAAYPHRPDRVEVRETHISWIFLAGDLTYKLKKPLSLPFVDYSTPERRRFMCEEEVRLNRPLAPEIYLGVRGVLLTNAGVELTGPDDPRALDYVVEMRRFAERDTLAATLDRGELTQEQVHAVGSTLARFHAQASAVTDLESPVLAVERQFDRNLQELLACVEQRDEIGRAQALERFAHAFVSRHAQMFRVRATRGHVRQGHGDLRAEHVLLGATVQIVDCVEFDRTLRELDVADDLAFLVFDLAARGGQRFADVLVRSYREAGGDPGGDALIAFYAAYRALVRAKVALVRASQLPRGSADHGHQSAAARELIAIAERFVWEARAPLIIAVCGLPASGKSHLAAALAERSGLPHLSSDVTRKRLAGIRATQRAPTESYAAAWNARTYSDLAQQSSLAVWERGGAIVDATFRHRSDRQAFTAALDASAPVLFIECQAPRAVLTQRARCRDDDPARVSDADVEVVARQLESWEPLDEVRASDHVVLRTDRAVDRVIADAVALLDQRLLDRLSSQ